MKSRLLLLLLGTLLMGNAPFEPPQRGSRAVYRHVSLIDGTGSPLKHDMAVVTDGDRIAAILPDSSLSAMQLDHAHVIDLSGRFLLPGYIDSHQHFATPPDRSEAEARLKRDVYSGITATRDMADDLRQMADVANLKAKHRTTALALTNGVLVLVMGAREQD